MLLVACGSSDATRAPRDESFMARFLDDTAFRRQSLEASIVDATNDYSARRLADYAVTTHGAPAGWDALPEWNPPVRPVTLDDAAVTPAPAWNGARPETVQDYVRLGEWAFKRYPAELDDSLRDVAKRSAPSGRFGFRVDESGQVAGLVVVSTADGAEHVSWTCSSCHSRTDEAGHVTPGAAQEELDRGALQSPTLTGATPEGWTWGPGRQDVTPDGVSNPVLIPDLRATSRQTHLHWEATLRNSLPALTVRVETLLTDGRAVRPPRELAVAIALYIDSLGDGGPAADDVTSPGAAVFAEHCDSCHHTDGSTVAPIPAVVIGTDESAARSTSRGTGFYRVPSLWGMGSRGRLLHDGSVPDLETLLDPERLPILPGHELGLDLDASERAALIAFLRTLGPSP